MLLRNLLAEIGTTYRRGDGTSAPAQDLLRREAVDVLRALIPVGYTSKGSGGRGSAAVTPWIAIFDDDETKSAQRGMYAVYLFHIERRTVSLVLIQGVTELSQKHGWVQARQLLQGEAAAIRDGFEAEAIADLDSYVDLGGSNTLTKNYECGSILARTYDIDALPTNATLVADLERFIRLYAQALDARSEARDQGRSKVQSALPTKAPVKRTPEFRPKSDSDVSRLIRGMTVRVQLKHETLVKAYGKYLLDRGFAVATNVHPRDVVAKHGGKQWLIEAKTVNGKVVAAARDALSQLYFYERFLYDPTEHPQKLALFNEPIGDALVKWLTEHEIVVVWRELGRWVGTHLDVAEELALPGPQEWGAAGSVR